MQEHNVKRRLSFFLAVEGASEQSFVAWLQLLSQKQLRIHLDAFCLGGMMPGMERENPDAASAETKLTRLWPSYRKPMSAQELVRKFLLDDLLRVARLDQDLQTLLKKIGSMS